MLELGIEEKFMKIGLPSALLNQYYLSFFKPFFEKLSCEVILSHETTKMILDKGVRKMVPEMCAPMKIYAGHVIELLDLNIDYVYIPRFVSIRDKDAFCPKFMGLPDLLEHAIPELKNKILTNNIISDSDDICKVNNYKVLLEKLNIDKKVLYNAVCYARKKWLEYRKLCIIEKYNSIEANNKVLYGIERKIKKQNIKIGVVGYVYDIYDDFISMNVLEKLSNLGVNTVTFEMLSENEIEKELKRFDKKLFWTFSNKTIGSAYHFLEDKNIDGVIHVTAFGCGPDSFIGKYLELDSEKYNKPFMTLRVDEHTGENHLQTRLEAFVDMIAKLKSEVS